MATLTTPGLYYEKADFGGRRIPRIRLDIPALIGVAARGPLHASTRVRSFAQFQTQFGACIETAFLAYSVKGFFENGGDECHIVRVAAPEATTATDPIAIQPADLSFSIVLSVAGFARGAVVTVTQAPDLSADVLLDSVDPVLRKLIWKHPPPPQFQAALPMEFATGSSQSEGTLLDATGTPVLRIRAESPGSWGNQLRVRVNRTSRASTRTRAGAVQPPLGDSSLVESLAGFGPHALVKVFQDQLPVPVETWHLVNSVDPARNRITWSVNLEPAFNLAQPITFEVHDFSLQVFERGVLREIFEGLSLIEQHERYVVNATADSHYVRVEDLHPLTPFPQRLPDPAATNLSRGLLLLRAGRNGTAAMTIRDFTGDAGAATKWGLRVLEDDFEIGAVAIPDLLMPPIPAVEFAPQPPDVNPCLLPCPPVLPDAPPPPPALQEAVPGFALSEVAIAQQTLIQHCETQKDRVALLDPPQFSSGKLAIDLAEIPAWRAQFDSKYAALYFPWLLVKEPMPWSQRVVRAIPPSGHVLGIYARTDSESGVHQAPANTDVRWAASVTVSVDAAAQGVLNPLGINCVRIFPGRGLLLYGARTVSSDPAWRFVNVRRLLIVIEKSTNQALQWSVFEPNDDILRSTITLSLTTLLNDFWSSGALRGREPGEAFFVLCNRTNNTQDMIDDGQLLAQVGVAPSIPAEFVVFRIGRVNDSLLMTEVS
jgi:hypothetical protein